MCDLSFVEWWLIISCLKQRNLKENNQNKSGVFFISRCLLCTLGPLCNRPMGVQNGKLPNNRMTASSQWDKYHAAFRGRLFLKKSGRYIGAWRPRTNNRYQFLQVGPYGCCDQHLSFKKCFCLCSTTYAEKEAYLFKLYFKIFPWKLLLVHK